MQKTFSIIDDILNNFDNKFDELIKADLFDKNLNGYLFKISTPFVGGVGDFEDFGETISNYDGYNKLSSECLKRGLKLHVYPSFETNQHIHILAPNKYTYSLLFEKID